MPYQGQRESLYGQVGSGFAQQPRVDLAGAFDALTRAGSSAIQAAIMRKQAEFQRGLATRQQAMHEEEARREAIRQGFIPKPATSTAVPAGQIGPTSTPLAALTAQPASSAILRATAQSPAPITEAGVNRRPPPFPDQSQLPAPSLTPSAPSPIDQAITLRTPSVTVGKDTTVETPASYEYHPEQSEAAKLRQMDTDRIMAVTGLRNQGAVEVAGVRGQTAQEVAKTRADATLAAAGVSAAAKQYVADRRAATDGKGKAPTAGQVRLIARDAVGGLVAAYGQNADDIMDHIANDPDLSKLDPPGGWSSYITGAIGQHISRREAAIIRNERGGTVPVSRAAQGVNAAGAAARQGAVATPTKPRLTAPTAAPSALQKAWDEAADHLRKAQKKTDAEIRSMIGARP